MSDDIDMENVPINNVSAEKITLSELYNAKSDISILFPTRSTWVIRMAQMEDEIWVLWLSKSAGNWRASESSIKYCEKREGRGDCW